MTLAEAIKQIQVVTGGLAGIKSAPSTAPEAAGAFPFAVAYPRSGTLTINSYSWGTLLHTIYVEIHVARTLLPAAIDQALPYVESFASALVADPTLEAAVDTVNGIRFTFGKMEWGGVETLGWRFEVDVKIKTA